jgi:hypothetical protein
MERKTTRDYVGKLAERYPDFSEDTLAKLMRHMLNIIYVEAVYNENDVNCFSFNKDKYAFRVYRKFDGNKQRNNYLKFKEMKKKLKETSK